MPEVTPASWLLLSEAAELLSPGLWFHDILTSGQVRVCGKRNGNVLADPIEDLLKRAHQARQSSLPGAFALFDISIDTLWNQITISAGHFVGPLFDLCESDDRRRDRAELAAVGITGPMYRQRIEFCEVRLERMSLYNAAAASGYRIATKARTRPGPKACTRERIAKTMLGDLVSGKRTPQQLQADPFDALSTEYGGSKNTANRARADALEQYKVYDSRLDQ